MQNVDAETVDGFADGWTRFDHSGPNRADVAKTFDDCFAVFPWSSLPAPALGLSRSQLVHDGKRRARPFRNTSRAALHAG